MSVANSPAVEAAPRRYRGLSVEERREQRRARLLAAGLELFGSDGYAGSSIRAISAAAGLNSRYFYESFSSREDLLYHVYQAAVAEVASAIVQATAGAGTVEEQAREGLRASWAVLTEDRRKARVIVLEVVGVSERLERVRRENRHAIADILMRNALSLAGAGVKLRMDPVLTARAMIGASMEVLVDWIHGDVEVSREEIVDQLTNMYTAVAEASVLHEKPRR
ncbi:MAG TPA: TetR/AcrR family transcriptional regulator [Solirubrobacteraceae bacterium]|jgi:AcrR family transcriptional regulator|nr:TetR/AcrR family transcriptional regulator [Solirubrobacteraceae bacterium]